MIKHLPNVSNSCRGQVLKILGIGCGIFVLLAIAVGIFIALHFRTWAANAAQKVIMAVMDQSELPEDQKKAIISQADDLTTGFKEGRVTMQQIGQVGEKFGKSPLLQAALLMYSDVHYIEHSKLDEEAKKSASLNLQRVSRGVMEGKIGQGAVQDLMRPLMTTDPRGQQRLKPEITDQERAALLEAAKKMADEAKISSEPYQADFAGEFKKIVDSVLH